MKKHHSAEGINEYASVDFDEWSTLFEQDPEEFERRRRELLLAEMAKGSSQQREHMAAVLDAYDERVSGLPAADRLQVASEFAIGSLTRLQDKLVELGNELTAPAGVAADDQRTHTGTARKAQAAPRRTSPLH